METVHINPKEAVKIHQDVQSMRSVGCHFHTFRLSEESIKQPPYDLYLALKEKALSTEDFFVLKPGESINW